MGFINPIMGDKSISLANALFTKVQQRVLGVLFGNPLRSFYGNEIVRLADSGIGAVQRELEKLSAAGLIVSQRIGNQRHFRANPHTPIYGELVALIAKTCGVAEVVRMALQPLADKLDYALIDRALAEGYVSTRNPIDLLLVGKGPTPAEVRELLVGAESRLGQSIRPILYTQDELGEQLREAGSFVARLLERPTFCLIGTDEAFAALGEPDQERSQP